MAPSNAAVERVRSQLLALGIGDDASIRHLALTKAGLRDVAPEVIGVFSTLADGDETKGMENEDAYMALVYVWRMSEFAADRWTAEQGRHLAAPVAAAVVPPAVVLPRPAFPPLPRCVLPASTPATAALTAATLAVLSADMPSSQKRRRQSPAALPARVPPSGRAVLLRS